MQLRVTVAAAARDTAEGAVVTAADWAADILSGAADADRYFTGDLRSAAEMIFSGYDFDRFSVELQVEAARFSVDLQVEAETISVELQVEAVRFSVELQVVQQRIFSGFDMVQLRVVVAAVALEGGYFQRTLI